MTDTQRGEYQRRYDGLKDQGNGAVSEDVEMGDGADDEAAAEPREASSFTAINRE